MEPYAGTLMTKWYRRRGYVSLMRSLWHTWRRMILSHRIYSSTFGKDQRLCSSSGRPFSQTSFRRSGTLPNNNQESSVNSGRPIHKLELCRRSGTLPHENRESSVNSGRPSHVLEKNQHYLLDRWYDKDLDEDAYRVHREAPSPISTKALVEPRHHESPFHGCW